MARSQVARALGMASDDCGDALIKALDRQVRTLGLGCITPTEEAASVAPRRCYSDNATPPIECIQQSRMKLS